MSVLRRLFIRLLARFMRRPVNEPEPGVCLLATGKGCREEIHFHGSAKFRRATPLAEELGATAMLRDHLAAQIGRTQSQRDLLMTMSERIAQAQAAKPTRLVYTVSHLSVADFGAPIERNLLSKFSTATIVAAWRNIAPELEGQDGSMLARMSVTPADPKSTMPAVFTFRLTWRAEG